MSHPFRLSLRSRPSHFSLNVNIEVDENKARAILLAVVSGKSIELTTEPAFPGNATGKPPFPNDVSMEANAISQTTREANTFISSGATIASFTKQIEVAFAQEDWSSVIRKVDYLSKRSPDTLSFELYHMQGLALLEHGDNQRAFEALDAALALANDNNQRLLLLEKYATTLTLLNRWEDALRAAKEALQLSPDNPLWLTLQQQTLTQLTNNREVSTEIKTQTESLPVSPPIQGLEIFFSYSHQDKELRDELEKYLINLKRQGSIIGWYDGEIGAGNEWANEIEKHLKQSNIILLLVSQDFIASNYCYEVEMLRALERHDKGEACVIPVILRPADWQVPPLRKLKALPMGAKPITRWQDRDEAFLDVAKGIQQVVDRMAKSIEQS